MAHGVGLDIGLRAVEQIYTRFVSVCVPCVCMFVCYSSTNTCLDGFCVRTF